MGMSKLNMLDTISQRKGFGMAAEHPTEPCQPLDRQHMDGQSLVKGIQIINDALAVGIEDDVLSMAVHYNLGEYLA